MASVHLTIDGKELVAEAGQSILQAAGAAGIDVPALCNHPALEPIGSCRMCLVEIEKQRALQPACTFQVTDGMVIHTDSEKVARTRKFLLELLFSERNHYCMYCQMSGDCELQSLAYRYGLDAWLYPRPYTPLPVDATRAHFVMDHNRCILCRRCVRACQELAGNYTLGLSGRGAETMIVADMDVPFGESSCISCGTCLQVCPTGALMDRRSAYRGREAEVEHTPTVCTACSLGCGMQVVSRDNQILRIEGDWDGAVNAGVLCAAGRFDILEETRRRTTSPMIRVDGTLQNATWDEALDAVADRLRGVDGAELAALATTRATNGALERFAALFNGLNAKSVSTITPAPAFMAEPEGSLAALDEADLYVVVGADLRVDYQVAGIMVQRGVMNHGARMALIDDEPNGMDDMAAFRFGSSEVDKAADIAARAEIPVVIYGAGAGDTLPQLRAALGDKAQFVGLVPGSNTRGARAAGLSGDADLEGVAAAYVMAVDESIDAALLESLSGAQFVVAQTSYLDALTERADVVLPSTIWAEKACATTNTEGRIQELRASLKPPAGVKQDIEILQALADKLG
ncbi:MAG: molybdopterin-dependent oxidoreductase [Anaerolineae bacterium]|nr:molybdopterin-dependent oxidoreductase [Anaerolineae bacterium]